MAKRIMIRVGNVYSMKLGNGEEVVFHNLGKNVELLYGYLVRVYKKRYSEGSLIDIDNALCGDIDYYAHVWDLRFGIEDGVIHKIGFCKDLKLDQLDSIWFIGKNFDVERSENWTMSQFNRESIKVFEIPKSIKHATYPDDIFTYSCLIKRSLVGKWDDYIMKLFE